MNTISEQEQELWSKIGGKGGKKLPEIENLVDTLLKLNGQKIDVLKNMKKEFIEKKIEREQK